MPRYEQKRATLTFWFIVVLGLLALTLLAPGLEIIPRRLLRVIGVYLGIAYVGRGVFLLILDPLPGPGTFVADQLLRVPTYYEGLQRLAPIAAWGIGSMLLGYYLVARFLRSQDLAPARPWPETRVRQTALIVALVGTLIRVIALLLGDSERTGLTGRLAILPTVALALMIVGTDWRRIPHGRWLVATMLVGEALWSITTETKTPILAAAAFLYLDPRRRKLSWVSWLAVAFAATIAFGVVQPNKTPIATADYGGHSELLPVGRVLVRFDLLRALTVAESAGPGSYMDGDEALERSVAAWLPQSFFGTEKTPSAVLWGERMNGSTSGAHVADGPIAEGYALFGMSGAIVWSLAAGGIGAAVASIIQRPRRYTVLVLAVFLVASNALFERGLLGLNERLAIGAQVVALAAGPYYVLRLSKRSGGYVSFLGANERTDAVI